MQTTPQSRPTDSRPAPFSQRLRASDHLVRAAACLFLNAAGQTHEGAETVAKRLWSDDQVTPILTRAATSPATITGAGWASQLAMTSVADFMSVLGPISAGSTLLKRGLQLSFDRSAAILVPGVIASAADVGFIGEGEPIPVRQYVTANATLAPRTLKTISTFTRELSQGSTPNIEKLVREIISQDVGLALDAAMFGTAAADATRPAGLRNGIAALVASPLTPASEAFFADIRALAAAVAPVAGNGLIVLIANPAQAVSLRLRLSGDAGYEVLSSAALAAGEIIAVAANALASALDPQPRFDISAESVLHMEDSSPLEISTAGSPNSIAAPTRSMFQTDSLALRMRFQVDWALRTTGAVAWLTTTAW